MIIKRKEFTVKRKQFVVKRKVDEQSCVKMATANIYFSKVSYDGRYSISRTPYYMPKRKAIRLKMKLEKVFYGTFELHDKN